MEPLDNLIPFESVENAARARANLPPKGLTMNPEVNYLATEIESISTDHDNLDHEIICAKSRLLRNVAYLVARTLHRTPDATILYKFTVVESGQEMIVVLTLVSKVTSNVVQANF